MSQFISLEQAIAMTTLYRQHQESVLAEPFQNKGVLARCETIERQFIETLLAKPGCAALRIYYGMDSSLKIHAIVVAVNEKDQDMIAHGEKNLAITEDDIVEESRRCPTDCPPPSELNP